MQITARLEEARALDPVSEKLQAAITAVGGSPVGTPGAPVAQRSWDDYAIGRADAQAHLAALDVVYTEPASTSP